MGKALNLTGQRFGKLVAIRPTDERRNARIYWECRCDCGNPTKVRADNLVSSNIKSCGCLRGKPKGEAAANNLYYGYVYRAHKKNYEFAISKRLFLKMVVRPCVYCGSTCKNKTGHKIYKGAFYYTGIDRIDNAKGYTPKNIVPCCKVCNRAKRKMSLSDFKKWAKRIATKKFWKQPFTSVWKGE